MHSPMDESWKKGNPSPMTPSSAKTWRREYGQQWDSKKTLKENLIQREEDAYFNCPAMDDTLPLAEPGDAPGNRSRSEYRVAHRGSRGLPRAGGIVAGYS